jgi:hypothetical protein
VKEHISIKNTYSCKKEKIKLQGGKLWRRDIWNKTVYIYQTRLLLISFILYLKRMKNPNLLNLDIGNPRKR